MIPMPPPHRIREGRIVLILSMLAGFIGFGIIMLAGYGAAHLLGFIP